MMKKLVSIVFASILLVFGLSLSGCFQHSANGTGGSSFSSGSGFPSQRAPSSRRTFIFNPKSTSWAAYDRSGALVKSGRASGGKSWCADIGRSCRTVTGSFYIYHKKGADCVSSKYPVGEGGARMPHCMFFHRGYAVHGSGDVPNYNASHGCIRVTPSAAQWLNNSFMTVGTKVIVRSYH